MQGAGEVADPAGPVTVRVLGPFEVSVGDRAVQLPAGRLRVLLAVLALHAGQPVPPDRVVDAVWGTRPPADVRRTLRTYLARLRDALETEAVENGRTGPVLRTSPDHVDALRFQRLVDAAAGRDPHAEHATLVEALGLWRGQAFEDLDSTWLRETEAVRLDERRLAALERRADLDLAAGRHDAVIAELRELAAAYPLRESLWARLLQALGRAGRVDEALGRYEEIRDRIADTLGADPGAELRAIRAELLAGGVPDAEAATAPRTVPRQLPPDLARFTGRDTALRSLDELLTGPGDRPAVVAITGVGGVGKTSLAAHWAHRVADRFPDGTLYVNLRGFGRGTPLTPAAALDSLLRGLGATAEEIPADADARGSTWRSLLADRRVLIVLDNARDADQVRPLLPGSGPSLTVVTSRSQLRSLVAREGARRIALDALEPAESRALLAATLVTQRVSYDEAALAELADRCAHLPLALVIAAERAGRDPEVGLAEVVEELRDRQDRLAALDAGDDESTDLRAVFAWSYDALDGETARLFRRLGLQPMADFSAPAAAALAGASVGHTRRLLDRLVDANLLQQRRAGRYEMHDLVREYAADLVERVDPVAGREAAYDRYVGWWVQTAANGRKTINRSPPLVDADPAPEGVQPIVFDDYDAAWSWFEAERTGLTAVVLDAYARSRRRPVHQMVNMAAHYLHQSRHLDELTGLLELAVDAARSDRDRAAEATASNLLGSVYNELTDYERSRELHERALAGFAASGHDRGQLATLNNLGSNAFNRGRPREAADYARRAHDVARRLGNPLAEVYSLNMLATAYIALGRHDEAVTTARTGLAIAERHDDPLRTAAVLDTLGLALAGRNEHDAAIDAMRRSAELFESLRDRWSVCIVHANLGRAYRAIGRPDSARKAVQRALEIFDELGGVDGPDLTRAELVALLDELTAS